MEIILTLGQTPTIPTGTITIIVIEDIIGTIEMLVSISLTG